MIRPAVGVVYFGRLLYPVRELHTSAPTLGEVAACPRQNRKLPSVWSGLGGQHKASVASYAGLAFTRLRAV